jgi:hypothetical protein
MDYHVNFSYPISITIDIHRGNNVKHTEMSSTIYRLNQAQAPGTWLIVCEKCLTGDNLAKEAK